MASITQGLALQHRMGYRPTELEISNATRHRLDFLIKMEVPRTGSFRCYEFTLSPFTTANIGNVIRAIESVILTRKCSVALKYPSSELFLNLYQMPTRDSCELILDEKEIEPILLPLKFEDGIDTRSVRPDIIEMMEMPLNKRLVEHYSIRYARFIKEQMEFHKEMIPRALLASETLIPKIWHFIWLGSFLKKEDQEKIVSFRKHHPDWQINIWIDHLPIKDRSVLEDDMLHFVSENRIDLQLIEDFFSSCATVEIVQAIKPIFAEAIEFRSFGMASDVLRMAILYSQGGVYSDCDNFCFRPFDRLNKSHTFFAGLCPASKGFIKINNDIIGASIGHPIVSSYLDDVTQYFEKTHEIFTQDQILGFENEASFIQYYQILKTITSTGPIPFSKAYRFYVNDNDDPLVMIYPPDVFHPGSREVHDFKYDGQPGPSSYSAAFFDMGWMSTQGDLMRKALVAEENFEKHTAIIKAYLDKPKAKGSLHQIHFFAYQIYKGVPRILDWLSSDSEVMSKLEILDLLLTDAKKEDVEKILPHMPDESFILVSNLLKVDFHDNPKVKAIDYD